jgi:hypothetical protein
LGQVLYLACYLAEVSLYTNSTCQDRFSVSFEALSADVCGLRYINRQRQQEKIKGLGAVDGRAVQKAIPVKTHAGAVIAAWVSRQPPVIDKDLSPEGITQLGKFI